MAHLGSLSTSHPFQYLPPLSLTLSVLSSHSAKQLQNYTSMTSYLPSAQEKRGDEYLDDARALRDRWKDIIPRGDLTSLQNRLTMRACYFLTKIAVCVNVYLSRATEMRAGLDLKSGLSRMSHARAYRKYAKETFQIAKVLTLPAELLDGALIYSYRRLPTEPEMSHPSTRHTTSSKCVSLA